MNKHLTRRAVVTGLSLLSYGLVIVTVFNANSATVLVAILAHFGSMALHALLPNPPRPTDFHADVEVDKWAVAVHVNVAPAAHRDDRDRESSRNVEKPTSPSTIELQPSPMSNV